MGGSGSVITLLCRGILLKEKAPMAPFASCLSGYIECLLKPVGGISLLDKTHGEIERPHMLGERPDRDKIDASGGKFS